MNKTVTRACAVLLAGCFALMALPAAAQEYPVRPITMIIPFPPAGSTDVLGRILAQVMGGILKQQVLVENVGGAGGTIGAARVARSKPDGYTVFFHNMAQASAPALYSKLTYDPVTDFESIGLVTDVPMILVARKDLPARDLQGVLAYAKANPGKLNFAHAGTGATSHLCELLLKTQTGLDWTSIPYKGTGPALNDLLGQQVDLICDQPASTTGHIKAGTIKPIAVATKARLRAFPEVATFSESGLPGFELAVWHGLYAPKDTPRPVVERLAQALRQALADPTVVQRFGELSAIPSTAEQATPEALRKFLTADVDKWRDAIRKSGVKPE